MILTIWKDGTWLVQDALTAVYCRDDPDWLTEIPVSEIQNAKA